MAKNDWVEVRDPYTGKLICRYERDKMLLEYKKGKVTTMIDLRQYDKKENSNGS